MADTYYQGDLCDTSNDTTNGTGGASPIHVMSKEENLEYIDINPGQIIFCTDTGNQYFDTFSTTSTSSTRIQITNTALKSSIDTNTSSISDINSSISTIESNVSTNTTNISSLQTTVDGIKDSYAGSTEAGGAANSVASIIRITNSNIGTVYNGSEEINLCIAIDDNYCDLDSETGDITFDIDSAISNALSTYVYTLSDDEKTEIANLVLTLVTDGDEVSY